MSDPLLPPPKTIQNIVFGAILILLFVAVCRLFAPFFSVLLWSILLYVLLVPLYQRLTRKMNFSGFPGIVLKNIFAGIFSLGTIVLILIPLFFVVSQFFKQIIELIRLGRDYLSANPETFRDSLEYVSNLIDEFTSGFVVINADDIQDRILLFLGSSLQNVIRVSSSIARNVGSFVAGLVFMLFCLFFFYMDGIYLSRLVLRIIPIRKEYISALVGKFKDITRNLFLGYIMVALIQAVMAYIIFSIFGVRGALVFAVLVLICSFLPMFGAGLVWLPLGIVRVLNGNVVGGIVFLAVSGFFISTLDNFLRPIFLQNRIQLHPLFIFVSILGGVMTFGFSGLILGPMVVIFFLTVLDLFLTEHRINLD
ncbi:MAG: AI-2E family transporter [Spirochaetaceae bacterium]|jgi:predicted PurR-regulated permease PerM|nr:AI-2E family transporter [Spirochaetaceae bacterium]